MVAIGRNKNDVCPFGAGVMLYKGATNGARTRDPQLGKLMLYQLSYYRNIKEGYTSWPPAIHVLQNYTFFRNYPTFSFSIS